MAKYKLKASNSRIWIRGKYYNNTTITDELIENQLKYHPEMLGQVFELIEEPEIKANPNDEAEKKPEKTMESAKLGKTDKLDK